jgi:NADH:ubiquinone oxidoreductase subunit 2 (subunit N)
MFITIALVAISSALAVIYFWKIVESLWFSSIKTEVVSEDPAVYIPIWIIAISIIVLGIFSAPIVELATMASNNLIGGLSN